MRDVHFFIDHGLGLRGGWNGSGYERQFIGCGITPMLLAINQLASDEFTQLASDEFDQINFGAPSLDKVVSLMCDGLAELSAKASHDGFRQLPEAVTDSDNEHLNSSTLGLTRTDSYLNQGSYF